MLVGFDVKSLRHQSCFLLVSPLLAMVARPYPASLSKHHREHDLDATPARTHCVTDLPNRFHGGMFHVLSLVGDALVRLGTTSCCAHTRQSTASSISSSLVCKISCPSTPIAVPTWSRLFLAIRNPPKRTQARRSELQCAVSTPTSPPVSCTTLPGPATEHKAGQSIDSWPSTFWAFTKIALELLGLCHCDRQRLVRMSRVEASLSPRLSGASAALGVHGDG